MRKELFAMNEYYHIYNRGVDKRDIFLDQDDVQRFFHGIREFNTLEPIGSIYEHSFKNHKLESSKSKRVQYNLSAGKNQKVSQLVNFICYCLNPNHYHFILEQVVDKGIAKFMQRLGTGYTNYFNNKYQRVGALFQGRFKAVHVDNDAYLLRLSGYVNLNDRVHQLGSSASKLVRSSWGEYIQSENLREDKGTVSNKSSLICKKDIILGQFNNVDMYKEFVENSLKDIVERREEDEKLNKLILE